MSQPYAFPPYASLPPAPASSPWRLGFGGLLRSEWLKLRSMTSTWVLVGISSVLGLYMTATSARAGLYFLDMLNQEYDTGIGIYNLSASMWGAPVWSGVLLALLGVLSITNEYSSGMIRTTLTVTPSRWPALAAKAIVVAAFAFVSTIVAEFLGALLTLPQATGVRFDLFLPSGLRVWVGSSLVLALMALLGLGLGTLVRSTAVSIVAYFGVMLILPLLFLFGVAAASSTYSGPDSSDVAFWMLLHMPAVAPFGVFTTIFDKPIEGVPIAVAGAVGATLFWTLVPLGLGFWAFQKRDV
ncbi:MAG: ABC transporter permease [Propionibacteriaceae bacterium]|nr:ABC transporter permease [Propionibacteriaceae bacterium]